MNRNNIWVHISFAVILVALAAVIGQIDRWRAALRTLPPSTSCPIRSVPKTVPAVPQARPPELLVRFKPGVSLDEIRRIAVAHHDQLEDEIESVKGLSVIDDLDNTDPNVLLLNDVVHFIGESGDRVTWIVIACLTERFTTV